MLNQVAEVEVAQAVTDSAPELAVMSWEVGDWQGHAGSLQADLEGTVCLRYELEPFNHNLNN